MVRVQCQWRAARRPSWHMRPQDGAFATQVDSPAKERARASVTRAGVTRAGVTQVGSHELVHTKSDANFGRATPHPATAVTSPRYIYTSDQPIWAMQSTALERKPDKAWLPCL
eukprot:1399699-Prymnesium_polylepis.2